MKLVDLRKKLPFDLSTLSLILANAYTIVLALINKWSFYEVFMIYWAQSLIIGFFTFIKILLLKKFDNKNPNKPTKLSKLGVGVFFLMHYGGFHLGYWFFASVISETTLNLTELILPMGVFFINHLFSFIYNMKDKELEGKDLGYVMAKPYKRIVPMHLTAILGVLFGNLLIGFLVIKAVVDVVMHLDEHGVISVLGKPK